MLSAFFGSVGLWPHHEVTPDMEARAAVALETMEVAHLADRVMNQLSSGESRRLLVARALAHGPPALVLDEPTNSLDLRACRDLTASLRRLAQQGTNIILVTHHLPDIIPEIDRVVVLKDGQGVARRPQSRRAAPRPCSPTSSASRSTSKSAAASTSPGARVTVGPELQCGPTGGCHYPISSSYQHRSSCMSAAPTMPSS